MSTYVREVTKMTADDAFGRFDRGEPIVFIDSRNPSAWSESDEKIPGAIRVPAADVQAHVSEIPPDRASGKSNGVANPLALE